MRRVHAAATLIGMSETPTPAFIPQIRLYQNWLRDTCGLSFDNYDALWRCSTTELDAFW